MAQRLRDSGVLIVVEASVGQPPFVADFDPARPFASTDPASAERRLVR